MSNSLGLADIAKRYARAFVNLFLKDLNNKQIEHLEDFILFLLAHKDILFYLELSFIKNEEKDQLIEKLLSKFELSNSFERLFKTLITAKRLHMLIPILRNIIELYRQSQNSIEFTVISSQELNNDQLKIVQEFLHAQTGKTIVLKKGLDKQLIAGIKLLSSDLGWEHSIQKQLRSIELLA